MGNEWKAVFNEVCRDDYYGIRDLPFTPTVIIDGGANVGAFTMFTRHLFPNATIIAVEPHPANFANLRQYTSYLPGIVHLKKALGTGRSVWHGDRNLVAPYYGALCSYVTPGQLGFPEENMGSLPGQEGKDSHPPYTPTSVQTIRLDQLMKDFTTDKDKVILKLDCEGGENCIFTHKPSMRALRRADYLTMETHYYAKGTGTFQQEVADAIKEGLFSLLDTHECLINESARKFQAIRRTFL